MKSRQEKGGGWELLCEYGFCVPASGQCWYVRPASVRKLLASRKHISYLTRLLYRRIAAKRRRKSTEQRLAKSNQHPIFPTGFTASYFFFFLPHCCKKTVLGSHAISRWKATSLAYLVPDFRLGAANSSCQLYRFCCSNVLMVMELLFLHYFSFAFHTRKTPSKTNHTRHYWDIVWSESHWSSNQEEIRRQTEWSQPGHRVFFVLNEEQERKESKDDGERHGVARVNLNFEACF